MREHKYYTCLRCGKRHRDYIMQCPKASSAMPFPRYRRTVGAIQTPRFRSINKGLFITAMTLLAIFIAVALTLATSTVVL